MALQRAKSPSEVRSAPRRPAARPRQRTQDRRSQLAAAALKILASKGALHLTAAELGREVGIADSTVFRHFRDMDEVIHAAIEVVTKLLDQTFPDAQSLPMDRLRAFVLARLALLRNHPEVLRLATSDRLEQVAGPDGARRLRAMMQRSRQFIESCLHEAQARGEIPADLDPVILGWVVRGTVQVSVAASSAPAGGGPSRESRGPEAVWAVLATLLRGSAS